MTALTLLSPWRFVGAVAVVVVMMVMALMSLRLQKWCRLRVMCWLFSLMLTNVVWVVGKTICNGCCLELDDFETAQIEQH